MYFNFKINCLEVVNSTITTSKSYLLQNNNMLMQNTAFLAKAQTGGVGKMGKTWHSEVGNVYLSILLKEAGSYNFNHQTDINVFNLLASLALQTTISGLINQQVKVFCKWPNDLLINEAKVSGILLEKLSTSDNETILLASFGVNLKIKPNIANYKTIALAEISNIFNSIEPIDFTLLLIKNILLLQNLNQQEIITLWLKNAYKLNETITVNLGNISKNGIFRGVSNKGLLLLETANGIEECSVGEVYV